MFIRQAQIFIPLLLGIASQLCGADPTPFGLQPVAPTQRWETGDEQAQKVQALFSPFFKDGQFNTRNLKWNGGQGFENMVNEITPADPFTNPYRLTMPEDGGKLRVYFVDEGASYQNSLGILQNTSSGGPNPLEVAPGPNVLLFPNASFDRHSSQRTEANPVKPMDYVDLGWVNEGESFEFFVIADGGSGAYDQDSIDFENPLSVPAEGIFFSDPSHNLPSDDLTMHFKIYEIPGYNNYYLIRVEDSRYGTDQSFDDLYFLVELVVPEPRTYLLLGTFLLLCGVAKFRARKTTYISSY